ncbi:MAG: hypothetical protein ACRDMH_01220 [Solirubrobacterales bacterium]
MAKRTHTCILAALALAVPLSGCGHNSPSSTIQAVSFRADAGPNRQPFRPSESQTILDLGDLTIRAQCARGEGGQPFLNVGASTGVDNATISSRFTERGQPPTPYLFVIEDFDKSYGDYDFLGHPRRAAGDLGYSRPDGGQVSLSYTTTSGAGGPADCFLGGAATYAPPQ